MKCNSTFKRGHKNINNCHNFPLVKLPLSVLILFTVRRAHLPRRPQLLSGNQDKAVSCSPPCGHVRAKLSLSFCVGVTHIAVRIIVRVRNRDSVCLQSIFDLRCAAVIIPNNRSSSDDRRWVQRLPLSQQILCAVDAGYFNILSRLRGGGGGNRPVNGVMFWG